MSVVSAPSVARGLADALEVAGVPYALGGAIAYGAHGPPRATNDVDLNIFLEPDALDTAFEALESAGAEVSRDEALASAKSRGDFNAWFQGMRIDVFVPSIPFAQQAKKNVMSVNLQGRPIRVLSAEDICVFKLLFFRPKDINDIERLLALRSSDLDKTYIEKWLVDTVGESDVRVSTWRKLVVDFKQS